MKKIYSGIISLGLLLISLSAPSYAQNDRANFYTVELIVFSNDLRMYREEENWPIPERLEIADQLLFLKSLPITEVYPELFQKRANNTTSNYLPLLGNEDKELNFAAERIRLAGRHRLLLHQSWLQKIESEENAQDIAILAGEERDGFYEISGSIRLHLGRYLHINTNLWRVLFAEDTEEAIDIQLPLISEKQHLSTTDFEQNNAFYSTETDVAAGTTQPLLLAQHTQPAVAVVAKLEQRRRMRSREVHYIDHPLFGLIIELRPYQAD